VVRRNRKKKNIFWNQHHDSEEEIGRDMTMTRQGEGELVLFLLTKWYVNCMYVYPCTKVLIEVR